MGTGSYIGWDIGGAHLKMAHIDKDGRVITACQIPTPLWLGLDKLDTSIVQAKKSFSGLPVSHSITTTAELSDIFSDRHNGLAKLVQIVSDALHDNTIRFYGGDAGWITIDRTDQYVREIASANWHATACFVAGKIDEGILVDIGSTTTDIIPFRHGRLLTQGYTDYERLSCGELVYTGIIRTPVMAMVSELPVNGINIPVIPEHFATMSDVYRLLGKLQEQDDMMSTADGAGKSTFESARRLARMLAIDIHESESLDKWIVLAEHIANVQQEKITSALNRILFDIKSKKPVLVGAGAGRFLVKQIATANNYSYLDFEDLLDASDEMKSCAARSAAAVAVAQLSRSGS